MNISKQDLEIAYRKLKGFIYYDNTLLDVRIKLSEYESNDFKKKLNKLYSNLKKYYYHNSSLEEYLNQISFSIIPKKYEENSSTNFYTNLSMKSLCKVNSLSVFIRCPIEIYLISVLWIMKIGYHIDKQVNDNCYANRIDSTDDYNIWATNSRLFTIYFRKYSQWRDQAISKAKDLHKNYDSLLVTLDIKDYFHSIDIDLKTLVIYEEYIWLNDLLYSIHNRYSDILFNNRLIKNKKNILPIGLMSSNILANYYLLDFDNHISNKFKAEYYGRYVDDILIVLKLNNEKTTDPNYYLDELIFNNRKWIQSNISIRKETNNNLGSNNSTYLIYINNNVLEFQKDKIRLFHFSQNDPINLLDEFEKEIQKNSSEFKLEPVEENVLTNFESSSYRISYSDSINKLRSIKGFSTNKLGASKHLSKIIEIFKYSNKFNAEQKENINSQIVYYFSGQRSIEYHSLWEKIITYFILSDEKQRLINFAHDQLETIEKIELNEEIFKDEVFTAKYKKNIKQFLIRHLLYSYAVAASLNIHLFSGNITRRLKKKVFSKYNSYLQGFVFPKIINIAKNIIKANLIRHQYCYYPLLNYCIQKNNISFVNEKIRKNTSFKLDPSMLKYSPRFIPLHEFIHFYFLRYWFSYRKDPLFILDPLRYSLEPFSKNMLHFYSKEYKSECKSLKKRKNEDFQRIIIGPNISTEKFRIGIVNMEVKHKDIYSAFNNTPNLSFDRLNEINTALNYALKKRKCDIIIFPEMSIPIQWLDNLLRYSRSNQVGIICGIEHFQNHKKEVFNYIATILPYEKKINDKTAYKNSVLDLRIKKDYSPDEIALIKKKRYKVPTILSKENLRLFKWNSAFFSSLNCFELTDLSKRIPFKGKVDFLCVTEYNKDVTYFSSIVESIARDIHAYIIQVNSSNYGDSRITIPADSYKRDLVKIKGGKDVSLIKGEIDIKKLREYQSNPLKSKKIEEIYKENQYSFFKPPPANFKIDISRKI